MLIPTAPKRLFADEPLNLRNLAAMHGSDSPKMSGDSLESSTDWIRPSADTWPDAPRPASRNIMNIDHGSAITVLPGSGSRSSSTGNCSTPLYSNPTPKPIQVLPSRVKSAAPRASSAMRSPANVSSYDDLYGESVEPPRVEPTTPIFRDTIPTGSDFR